MVVVVMIFMLIVIVMPMFIVIMHMAFKGCPVANVQQYRTLNLGQRHRAGIFTDLFDQVFEPRLDLRAGPEHNIRILHSLCL